VIKFVVFVPLTHLEQVKNAMFEAGAGKIGNYDRCSFELVGKGQFRPLEGSTPFLGSTNQVESVDEARVEMVCEDAVSKAVLHAMKRAHPYEEVAFDLVKLLSTTDLE